MATITDNDLKMFQERARNELTGRGTGSIAWDSVIWDLCHEVRKLRSASKERGDAAKLREALKATLDLLWDIHNANRSPQSNQAYAVIRQIKAALAAPPRNCDVGTAEEQEDRFRRYCNSRGTFCGDCPLYNNRRGECRFAWAQKPYKKGSAE